MWIKAKLEKEKGMQLDLVGMFEVKLPLTGEEGWVAAQLPEAARIMTPVPPPGSKGTPTPVPAK